jgi:drug/metabolite transporter (DMT)-like permease
MPEPTRGLADRPYALLLFTMLAWAGNSIASRLAVGEVSPMVLTSVRWGLVLIALFGSQWKRIADGWPAVRARWPAILAMGATGYTFFNALYFTAAHHTTAVNLSIVQGAMPALVLLGGLAVYRTPIRGGQTLGMVVTLAGIAVVACKGHIETLRTLSFNPGDIMIFGACVLYAGFTVALRSLQGIPGMALFGGMAVAAFITSLPIMGLEIALHQHQWPTLKGWVLLTYIGLVPTAMAQLAFLRAVALIGPGRAGLFVNLVPIFGAILAVAILHEPFGLYHAVALALVLAGILLAEKSARKPTG